MQTKESERGNQTRNAVVQISHDNLFHSQKSFLGSQFKPKTVENEDRNHNGGSQQTETRNIFSM